MVEFADHGWEVMWPDAAEQIEATEAQRLSAESYAGYAMRLLTLYRVGGQPVTVMPCPTRRRRHGDGPFPDPYLYAGRMYNDAGGDCGLTEYVELPRPVGRVDEVRVGGVVLDPANYHVENGNRLVRTDGEAWPSEASSDFTVTYLNAYPVDGLGAYAAGILALEFLKGLVGDRTCRLPSTVTSLNRAGVAMEITPGLFPNGRTGINEVDIYVRGWNPYGLVTAPTVSSPDLPKPRTVTWRA